MKKLLLSISLFAVIGSTNAMATGTEGPIAGGVAGEVSATSLGAFLGGVAPYALTVGAVWLMATHDPGPCFHEPVRNVSWKANPGYSFDVAGCDYQTSKDKLIVN